MFNPLKQTLEFKIVMQFRITAIGVGHKIEMDTLFHTPESTMLKVKFFREDECAP